MMSFRRSALFVVLSLSAGLGQADIPGGYMSVAQTENVPARILYAVACAESGRRMPDGQIRPWPWALNVAGESRFYPTRLAAYRDLTSELIEHPHIDIGLGQINWRWHSRRLQTPWLALDPYFNLTTAAKLLRAQFERCQCEDWWAAVERYHAPSESTGVDERRRRYRAKVERCWRRS